MDCNVIAVNDVDAILRKKKVSNYIITLFNYINIVTTKEYKI